MILAIDIGNTSIHLGAFQGGRLRRQMSLPTRLANIPGRLRRTMARLGIAEEAIICSVVPRVTPVVAQTLRQAGCGRVRMVGRHVKVPLTNKYTYPEQVGQDRLGGAYAAWKEFRRDCIVCDFGTAITIDIVKAPPKSRGGSHSALYLGGVIAPGLEISLEALANRTALLPKVELKEPPELLGRDTADSIRSGLLYGCVALCDGLTAQLKRQYAPKAVVVATGGASPLIAKHARTIDHLRPNLVLEGLFQLIHH